MLAPLVAPRPSLKRPYGASSSTTSHGTEAVCRAVADSDCGMSIIGGGGFVAAVNKFGLADR